MAHKIFISYKYGDVLVRRLPRTPSGESTSVRHYVDELQDLFKCNGQINKGELDDEDLSHFKDSTIESKLRNKIYDSSVTVVLISPKMKECLVSENDQWIPWEISYSLRETTRGDRTSRPNGVLAVVLPDRSGNYNYVLQDRACCKTRCRCWYTIDLFEILKRNMFNQKNKEKSYCKKGDNVYSGYFSYIHMIRWDEFVYNINYWIEVAISIRDNKDLYDIRVNVQ